MSRFIAAVGPSHLRPGDIRTCPSYYLIGHLHIASLAREILPPSSLARLCGMLSLPSGSIVLSLV
ncbi:MAG: hypothetical protein ACOCY8_05545, partial [Spirochaetota bacterium]